MAKYHALHKNKRPGSSSPPGPAHSFSSRCRFASSRLCFVNARSYSLTRHSIPRGSLVCLHARDMASCRRLSGKPPIVSTSRPNVSRSQNISQASQFRLVNAVGFWHVEHGGSPLFDSFKSRQTSQVGLAGFAYHSAHAVSFFFLPVHQCGPRSECGTSGQQ